jgi:hypothetical protein
MESFSRKGSAADRALVPAGAFAPDYGRTACLRQLSCATLCEEVNPQAERRFF